MRFNNFPWEFRRGDLPSGPREKWRGGGGRSGGEAVWGMKFIGQGEICDARRMDKSNARLLIKDLPAEECTFLQMCHGYTRALEPNVELKYVQQESKDPHSECGRGQFRGRLAVYKRLTRKVRLQFAMSRQILLLFLATGLLFSGCLALDLSIAKEQVLDLTESDIVPKAQTRIYSEERNGFIGDLVIGQRHADETVFSRVMEVVNPTNFVQSSSVALNVKNGLIHYIRAINGPGSAVVVCDGPYSLGSSSSQLRLRLSPNSRAVLNLLVAAH
ncbi:uncharacterized protein [Prorops nasuta]|uniref:uncharacterized protein n=1 Tax=Prorops nasuta TaxID=863751 RepID=UPI0034CFB013